MAMFARPDTQHILETVQFFEWLQLASREIYVNTFLPIQTQSETKMLCTCINEDIVN